jgi:hypothetical protein
MQNEQNPDVNTPHPDDSEVESGQRGGGNSPGRTNVERPYGEQPVPPDTEPGAPVEEPPDAGGLPMGDVDDSPKRIV